MSSLVLTVPITLLLAAALVALVVRAALRGEFDDWEGPAARALLDDDTTPELEAAATTPAHAGLEPRRAQREAASRSRA
jgi:cbb3-type cytochrome oxidase maturation protein